MQILDVKELAIPEVKVITFKRFIDNRGYFTEIYRKNEFDNNPQTQFLKDLTFTQINESSSQKGTIRGFHFQWNPFMAKMLRVIRGRIIDMALDIRPNSATFGKIVGYEIFSTGKEQTNDWIYIPVGFAHGLFLLEDSVVEYMCTGYWAPETEKSISPLAKDIDWTLFDPVLKTKVDEIYKNNPIISDKDKNGPSLEEWKASKESENFK